MVIGTLAVDGWAGCYIWYSVEEPRRAVHEIRQKSQKFYTIINWKIKLTRYWLIYNRMWKMWSTGVHYYM